jgi:hypothetical protein
MDGKWSWTSNGMIALYIAMAVAAAGVGGWFLMRKMVRTRMGMEKSLRLDPDINDWLVIFGWTPKVLYVPTIAVSVLAAVLMFMQESGWRVFAPINPKLVGGVWFTIFFVNFLIEEYDISIKILIISIVGAGFLLLWLHLLGWVVPFFKLLRHLAFSISATGYLLIAIIGLLTVGISWLRGLFFYVAVTPNSLNLQEGPTEAGEQIGREDYNTKIDTGDFLERLLGFGRITFTFKEKSRLPLTLLVWHVERKAQILERVRSKLALDYPQQTTALQQSLPPFPPTPQDPLLQSPPPKIPEG